MKTVRIITLIGGAGLIGYALFKYFTIQKQLLTNFKYKIIGVNFSDFSLDTVTANITIAFTNYANFEVKVKNFYVDLFVNQSKIGYFVNNGEFSILANETTNIPVTVTFSPKLILSNIASITGITLNLNDIMIGVHGYAQVSSSFINVTVPVDYDSTIKQMISN